MFTFQVLNNEIDQNTNFAKCQMSFFGLTVNVSFREFTYKIFDPIVQTMVRNSIWHVTNLSFLASIFPSVTTTQNLAMEN